jgi:hypothetical protein
MNYIVICEYLRCACITAMLVAWIVAGVLLVGKAIRRGRRIW